ncbi:MAG TPA: CopG family transcriptional regulator [Tepidiformaceae bacterium]
MRTTLDIDDALHRRAKELAARTGRSLTSVIEDSLRQSLANEARRADVRFTTAGKPGKGLKPGIDLDRWPELLEAIEGPRARP